MYDISQALQECNNYTFSNTLRHDLNDLLSDINILLLQIGTKLHFVIVMSVRSNHIRIMAPLTYIE